MMRSAEADITVTAEMRSLFYNLTDDQIREVVAQQAENERHEADDLADQLEDAMARIIDTCGWQAFKEYWRMTYPTLSLTPLDIESLAEKVSKQRHTRYVGLLSTILSATESSSEANATAKSDHIKALQETLEE